MTLEQNPIHQVPEGDLPPGTRPAPGRRPERSVWTGIPDEAPSDDFRTLKGGRIHGLDAARGIALLGMVAVHTLPVSFDNTDVPTLSWTLFAGDAAALFALLAGVSLALLTGGRNPHRHSRRKLSTNSLVVRALLILSFGLLLNYLPMEVFNILPYYGVFFLLAIPFLRMGPLRLLLAAAFFAVVGPVIAFLVAANFSYEAVYLPTFTDLYFSPLETVLSLLVNGTFPAVTWMAFLCVGMALGRIDLTKLSVQIQLMITGALLAALATGVSQLLLHGLGGWTEILRTEAAGGGQLAHEIIVFGPVDFEPRPTESWWWLAISGPHNNTLFSIGTSLGVALTVLGACLLISNLWKEMLVPLIAAGSMTLTLYTAHLIFMAVVVPEHQLGLWFIVQIGLATLFATVWYQAIGRGPLEAVMYKVSKKVGAAVTRLPVRTEETEGTGGAGNTGRKIRIKQGRRQR